MEKSGYKTTEFWLSFLAMALGVFVVSGAFGDQHWAVKIAGLALELLGALGYTASRAKVKLGGSLERAEIAKASGAASPVVSPTVPPSA